MPERETVISNRLGLHARAAARLVQTVQGFKSGVWLRARGHEVDARSIMGVMMLAAAKGATVMLETEGEDESEAIEALSSLVAARFGEAE